MFLEKSEGKGKSWWVFISYNGQRTSRRVGDKKAAEDVASKIRAKLQLGQFGFEKENPIPTFKEYADSWIKTTVPATCKESTLSDYQDILRVHVLPVFQDIRVTDITRGKIKDFLLGKVNEGYANSTVVHLKNVVSGVLNKALADETIGYNPAHRLGKIAKAKDRKEDINPLSSEELSQLLDTVFSHYSEHYTLFLLLARTGMRIGEALALRWDDINIDERFADVQRSLVRGKISTPKNGKSRRVDLSRQLTEALKAGMANFTPKVVGQADVPRYVFTTTTGELIDKDYWRRSVFFKALTKADIRRIRIHDLRHTYATLRLAKGDNVTDVSKQLGHYSVKLTLDVYNHWIPGSKKSEVDALDDDSPLRPVAPHMHPEPVRNKKRA